MARKPDTNARTAREAAWLVKTDDPRVIWNNPGLTWNIPAARTGTVEIGCRVEGDGFRLGLADHWINPSDPYAAERCVVSVPVTRETAGGGWTTVKIAWNCGNGKATLSCGKNAPVHMPLLRSPRFGISYVHIQSLAKGSDCKGTYFTELEMKPNEQGF